MNVVVAGGGTIAPVDDVRLLTNVSSGRLAAAIAESFLDRGAVGLAHPHPLGAAPAPAAGPVRPRRGRPVGGAGSADAAPPPMAGRPRSPAPRAVAGGDGRRLRGDAASDPRRPADRRRRPAHGGLRLRARALRGEAELRGRDPGPAMPPHAQGDPLGARLGALGLPGRLQVALECPAGGADPPRRGRLPDQPGRSHGRQRPADAAPGEAQAPPGPPRRASPRPSSPATTWPTGWSRGS